MDIPANAAFMAVRKVIALDVQYANRVARSMGFRHFPAANFTHSIVVNGADILDGVAAIPVFPAEENGEKDAARVQATQRCQHSLQDAGFRTLLAPAKCTPELRPDGRPVLKHSDDQYLMINVLLTCMRLRPQFVVLVAGDGDYAPLVWALREEGMRTEVVADPYSLAADLRRAAYSSTSLRDILRAIPANNGMHPAIAAA